MAARWVGLSRPRKKISAATAAVRRGFGHTIHEFVHALGAVGFLFLAAAMNFTLYPDALAAVVSGERPIIGFVPPAPPLVAVERTPLQPIPVSEDEVRLLAATAWGEARSEGEDGMRAVAHVMVNRVGARFGDSLETVIRAPKQFSVWNRCDPNRRLVSGLVQSDGAFGGPEWETAQRVAREVLSGQSVDPTNGALFYHTRAIRPWWSPYGQGRRVIGAHVFYRDVPDRIGRRSVRPQGHVIPTSARAPAARRSGDRVAGTLPAPTTTISAPVTPYTPSPEAAAAIAQLPTSATY